MFDTNGNVLHYVVKTDTPERRKKFLGYLRYLVKVGSFDSDEQALAPEITVERSGRRVQLKRNARLRHARR